MAKPSDARGSEWVICAVIAHDHDILQSHRLPVRALARL